ALPTDAERREVATRLVENPNRQRIRLGRRLEPRDRALEQQLIARRVFGRELHEQPGESLQVDARIAGELERGAAFHQRTIPFGEHRDRKSTRLNSSHVAISYAVFCLKKNM